LRLCTEVVHRVTVSPQEVVHRGCAPSHSQSTVLTEVEVVREEVVREVEVEVVRLCEVV